VQDENSQPTGTWTIDVVELSSGQKSTNRTREYIVSVHELSKDQIELPFNDCCANHADLVEGLFKAA